VTFVVPPLNTSTFMQKSKKILSDYLSKKFENDGYLVIKNFVTKNQKDNLLKELSIATKKNDKKLFDYGMVHNCFLYGKSLLNVLKLKKLRAFCDELLCDNSIIYAYQSSSIPPNGTNYGSRIHKDTPRFIKNYMTNLGFILSLTDFNSLNGPTEVLPGSHKTNKKPSNFNFDKNKRIIKLKAGDAIFFNANLWHRAGQNKSVSWRYALTINFCRPYMRSRFDFPRLIKNHKLDIPNNNSLKKFLNFDVRIPTSLSEFYLPNNKRLYKPNQE
jgi:ectoine hydroxylase-related dioxygenase (phytanoyl-CoA dioxygenase family)